MLAFAFVAHTVFALWRERMTNFEPIGIVRNSRTAMSAGAWATVESDIELRAELLPGLAGLQAFSHVLVVFHLDRMPPFDVDKQLLRQPRGMEKLAPVGVFAQRTKFRPNPIGVASVPLVAVTENGIRVQGLDALDGTPVLDIKPYIAAFDAKSPVREPDWVEFMMDGYF
jgi:tRNA-Thr(GGU) m(6)t(6)A37 methyltransferase TsaA